MSLQPVRGSRPCAELDPVQEVQGRIDGVVRLKVSFGDANETVCLEQSPRNTVAGQDRDNDLLGLRMVVPEVVDGDAKQLAVRGAAVASFRAPRKAVSFILISGDIDSDLSIIKPSRARLRAGAVTRLPIRRDCDEFIEVPEAARSIPRDVRIFVRRRAAEQRDRGQPRGP